MGAMNFRSGYQFDPKDPDNQNAGGMLGLLKAAIQKGQGQTPGANLGAPPNAVPGYPQGDNSPLPGGLLGRLVAAQAGRGLQQPLARNNNEMPSGTRDPNFRQLVRVPSNTTSDDAPVQIPTSENGWSGAIKPAQFIDLFVRPPMWVPEELTPLEDLPPGSAFGERAGMDFLRSGRPKTPEEYPPCTYCRKQTSPDDYHEDHIIPRSRGGDGSDTNKAPACEHCNLQKRDMTPAEWYEWMRLKGLRT